MVGHVSSDRVLQLAGGGSPCQYLGPGPWLATRSYGLRTAHRSSERQPQPMQSVSPSFRRSSSSIRSSIRSLQVLVRRSQSCLPGTRSVGSFSSSARISSSVRPMRWAKTTHERHAPRHRASVAPVARGVALGVDEAALFVEAQSRGGYSGPLRGDAHRHVHERFKLAALATKVADGGKPLLAGGEHRALREVSIPLSVTRRLFRVSMGDVGYGRIY
jgi:hypothetical protein